MVGGMLLVVAPVLREVFLVADARVPLSHGSREDAESE